MWNYEKRLQFPVNIKTPNPEAAKVIISQYGGPDGEMGASMRYLSQRFATPYREVSGLLTDIGTEETEHVCWKSFRSKNGRISIKSYHFSLYLTCMFLFFKHVFNYNFNKDLHIFPLAVISPSCFPYPSTCS